MPPVTSIQTAPGASQCRVRFYLGAENGGYRMNTILAYLLRTNSLEMGPVIDPHGEPG